MMSKDIEEQFSYLLVCIYKLQNKMETMEKIYSKKIDELTKRLDIYDQKINDDHNDCIEKETIIETNDVLCNNSEDLEKIMKNTKITSLIFDSFFNQNIDIIRDKFNDLRSLSFGIFFNQNIDSLRGSFPNLERLSFGTFFNQNIDELEGSFPNLKKLSFGNYFNKNINKLCNSFPKLTHLSFGFMFNQNMDAFKDSFPNLTELSFGIYFNQDMTKLKHSFPKLKKLYINGSTYNNIGEYLESL